MEQTTKQPPRSLLEKLPLHLLILICECLAQLQPRTRRSIFALSLASKACCEATNPERFRHIHLAIAGPQKLQRDTQHWRQILQTEHRLRFVRSVKITGFTISPSVEEEQMKSGNSSGSTLLAIQQNKALDVWERPRDADEEVPNLFNGLDKTVHPNFLWPCLSTAWLDESAWKPLVDLISDLPGLRDVIFASWNQFPRLLLSELHEHHPRCRLHIHWFKLRSLLLPEREEQKVHPDEIALATSPCLYSIVVQTQPYHGGQTLDFNEEAVMSMVKGVAPNLKNVSLTRGFQQSAPGPKPTIPRPQWKGFQIPSEMLPGERSSTGRLENLALDNDTTGDKLLQWSYRTDFRHLRSLKCGPSFYVCAIKQLAEVSRQTPLMALQSLTLKLDPSLPFSETNGMGDAAVAELLQSLYPLEDLELEGHVGEKSFEAITTHHTERLRKLSFICQDSDAELFKFSPERAAQLSRDCPRLETVHVREPKYFVSSGVEDWSDWI